MSKKEKDLPQESPADRAIRLQAQAGEEKEQAYALSLNPRDRERLAPWAK